MINRRVPKVFFSSYSQTQRGQSNFSGQSSGQLRQLIIVTVIIVGGYFFTRLPVFQIKTIEINPAIDAAIRQELDSLKGQSILAAAVTNRIDEIALAHPELEKIDCIKGIPDRLRCQVRLREPSLGWATAGTVYLLDQHGVAYQITTSDTVPVVEDRKNLKLTIGDQPISSEVLLGYRSIQSSLTESGYTIDKFFVNTSVLHVGVILSARAVGLPFPANPIEVEFSLSYPAAIQINILNLLLNSKSSQIHTRIDLRTPGYLYYK